jgi:hypothetical protein
VEKELLTRPGHQSGVRVAQYLTFSVVFCGTLFVLLCFIVCPTIYGCYPFGIFNHFLHKYQEEFEDTKDVIIIRKSKNNRQHNGHEKKYKQRSTKYTHKTKDPH